MPVKQGIFLSMPLSSESDVILVRRRSRQISVLVGFESSNQTRLATAVSEAARFLFSNDIAGRVDFILQHAQTGLLVEVSGKRRSANHAVNLQNLECGEILAAKNLVDKLEIVAMGDSIKITIFKAVPNRVFPFSTTEIEKLSNELAKIVHDSILDEIHGHNQELINSLDELEANQKQLDQAMKALENQNEMLAQLNQEIRQLNADLENKVLQRTIELEKVNKELVKARDEALLAAQLKTQFVANVSHEIRTPLCGIVGLSEILSLEGNDPTSTQEMAKTIYTSSQQLISVVNQLLDFSKLQAAKTELQESAFELLEVVEESLAAISNELSSKKMSAETKYSNELASSYRGDREKLKQILINFLHNAVKFSDDGSVELRANLFRTNAGKDYIRFDIVDNGIGITEAGMQRLFQPFVQVDGSNTRKYGGTGLGLSLAKGLAELMGGTVGCDSEEGEGSTFWAVLPFAPVRQ